MIVQSFKARPLPLPRPLTPTLSPTPTLTLTLTLTLTPTLTLTLTLTLTGSVPSLPPLEPRALAKRRALTCDAPFCRWSTFEPACAAVAAIDTQTLRKQVGVRVAGVAASPVYRACRPMPEPATQSVP